jgi:hypothetical protein
MKGDGQEDSNMSGVRSCLVFRKIRCGRLPNRSVLNWSASAARKLGPPPKSGARERYWQSVMVPRSRIRQEQSVC